MFTSKNNLKKTDSKEHPFLENLSTINDGVNNASKPIEIIKHFIPDEINTFKNFNGKRANQFVSKNKIKLGFDSTSKLKHRKKLQAFQQVKLLSDEAGLILDKFGKGIEATKQLYKGINNLQNEKQHDTKAFITEGMFRLGEYATNTIISKKICHYIVQGAIHGAIATNIPTTIPFILSIIVANDITNYLLTPCWDFIENTSRDILKKQMLLEKQAAAKAEAEYTNLLNQKLSNLKNTISQGSSLPHIKLTTPSGALLEIDFFDQLTAAKYLNTVASNINFYASAIHQNLILAAKFNMQNDLGIASIEAGVESKKTGTLNPFTKTELTFPINHSGVQANITLNLTNQSLQLDSGISTTIHNGDLSLGLNTKLFATSAGLALGIAGTIATTETAVIGTVIGGSTGFTGSLALMTTHPVLMGIGAAVLAGSGLYAIGKKIHDVSKTKLFDFLNNEKICKEFAAQVRNMRKKALTTENRNILLKSIESCLPHVINEQGKVLLQVWQYSLKNNKNIDLKKIYEQRDFDDLYNNYKNDYINTFQQIHNFIDKGDLLSARKFCHQAKIEFGEDAIFDDIDNKLQDSHSLLKQGMWFMTSNKHEEANEWFNQALATSSLTTTDNIMLVSKLVDLEQYQKAYTLINTLLSTDKNLMDNPFVVTQVHSALLIIGSNQPEFLRSSISTLKSITDTCNLMDKDKASYYLAIATLYAIDKKLMITDNKDYNKTKHEKKIMKYLEKGFNLDNSNKDIAISLANLQCEDSQFEKAKQTLTIAMTQCEPSQIDELETQHNSIYIKQQKMHAFSFFIASQGFKSLFTYLKSSTKSIETKIFLNRLIHITSFTESAIKIYYQKNIKHSQQIIINKHNTVDSIKNDSSTLLARIDVNEILFYASSLAQGIQVLLIEIDDSSNETIKYANKIAENIPKAINVCNTLHSCASTVYKYADIHSKLKSDKTFSFNFNNKFDLCLSSISILSTVASYTNHYTFNQWRAEGKATESLFGIILEDTVSLLSSDEFKLVLWAVQIAAENHEEIYAICNFMVPGLAEAIYAKSAIAVKSACAALIKISALSVASKVAIAISGGLILIAGGYYYFYPRWYNNKISNLKINASNCFTKDPNQFDIKSFELGINEILKVYPKDETALYLSDSIPLLKEHANKDTAKQLHEWSKITKKYPNETHAKITYINLAIHSLLNENNYPENEKNKIILQSYEHINEVLNNENSDTEIILSTKRNEILLLLVQNKLVNAHIKLSRLRYEYHYDLPTDTRSELKKWEDEIAKSMEEIRNNIAKNNLDILGQTWVKLASDKQYRPLELKELNDGCIIWEKDIPYTKQGNTLNPLENKDITKPEVGHLIKNNNEYIFAEDGVFSEITNNITQLEEHINTINKATSSQAIMEWTEQLSKKYFMRSRFLFRPEANQLLHYFENSIYKLSEINVSLNTSCQTMSENISKIESDIVNFLDQIQKHILENQEKINIYDLMPESWVKDIDIATSTKKNNMLSKTGDFFKKNQQKLSELKTSITNKTAFETLANENTKTFKRLTNEHVSTSYRMFWIKSFADLILQITNLIQLEYYDCSNKHQYLELPQQAEVNILQQCDTALIKKQCIIKPKSNINTTLFFAQSSQEKAGKNAFFNSDLKNKKSNDSKPLLRKQFNHR